MRLSVHLGVIAGIIEQGNLDIHAHALSFHRRRDFRSALFIGQNLAASLRVRADVANLERRFFRAQIGVFKLTDPRIGIRLLLQRRVLLHHRLHRVTGKDDAQRNQRRHAEPRVLLFPQIAPRRRNAQQRRGDADKAPRELHLHEKRGKRLSERTEERPREEIRTQRQRQRAQSQQRQ